jgi:hypothetical protein
MSHTSAIGLCLATALVVAAGTTVIGGLAVATARLTRSAVWQRTIWQAAVLGVFFLLAVELTGTSAGLWQLMRQAVSDRGQGEGNLPEARRFPADLSHSERGSMRVAGQFALPAQPGRLPEVVGRGEGEPHLTEEMEEYGPSRFPLTPTVSRRERGTSHLGVSEGGRPIFAAGDQGFWTESRAGVALAIVWWLGAAGLLVRTAHVRVLLGRFRRLQAACDDAAIGRRVEALARRLGIRQAVDVRTSHGLAAPVAFGVLRPVLVLPPAFGERFDRGQQEAILAHELAHLAAGDAVWLLLADLLAAMLWWQPVVWWFRRRLRAAGEAAADEASLLVPDGPHTLAACLVALGGQLAGSGRLGWQSMAGSGFRSGLGHRVQRLLDLDRRPSRTPGRGWVRTAKVFFVPTLVIVAVTCTAWARPQALPSEGETTMHVLSHSWRHSLAAALVMAFWTTAAEPVRADDQPKSEGAQAEHKEGRAPSATPEQPGPAADARGERREAESRRGGPEGRELPPELAERLEKRRALHQEAESVLRKVMELKSGDEEQAKKLFESLKDLAAKIEQLSVPPPAIAREVRQLERLASTLQAAKAKAQQFGSQEAVAWLEQASQKIRQEMELAGRAGRGPGGEARPGREDGEHRLQHLRAAIENLRAAGMGQMADALEREIGRGLQGRPDQQASPGGTRERPGRGDRPDMERRWDSTARFIPTGPSGNLQQDVQQMRGEVQSLHQQLNEMREMLKRLTTHEQKSDREAPSPRER